MIAVMKAQKEREHPLKYIMWIACASIVMMFAGLSSAFIVKRNQANWITFDIPTIFFYSTAVIMLSSLTLILCKKAFVNRKMAQYKGLLFISMMLGIAFVIMQYIGFEQLWGSGITLTRNVAFSFLYVIVGLHALHVFGGVVGMVVIFAKSMNPQKKSYSSLSIELMNTYWHFVDFLWIYLLIFLIVVG
ncbi:MAG: cytochrome c oxidase subunit 3 [Ginsengibacter sp.]|jgi:cytochrome c oxidase subunit 3